ncbi:MAG: GGDEF domain-containing protein, partial [Candidatus Omnitrophota bacterium]
AGERHDAGRAVGDEHRRGRPLGAEVMAVDLLAGLPRHPQAVAAGDAAPRRLRHVEDEDERDGGLDPPQQDRQAGDRALEKLAEVSKAALRYNDHIARYGGEEFAAILPNTTKAEAVILAQRLLEAIEKETTGQDASLLPQQLTVSIGVSSLPEDTSEKDKLIFCADGALYDAKRAGKNRVCVYEKPSSRNPLPR